MTSVVHAVSSALPMTNAYDVLTRGRGPGGPTGPYRRVVRPRRPSRLWLSARRRYDGGFLLRPHGRATK